MAPRLEACYFAGPDRAWQRLARVLSLTATEQCPDWQIHVEAIEPGPAALRQQLPRTIAANSRKLERWTEIVEASADGDRLLLIDADTMILQPLDAVWDLPFELAYTVRDACRFPLNGGVIFVRVCEAVRVFMRAWAAENATMLVDRAHHTRWQLRYGGINQAAFGALLESGALASVRTSTLPCREWNVEDSAWRGFDPALARILHIKSSLRLACLHPLAHALQLESLSALWREADARAAAAIERTA